MRSDYCIISKTFSPGRRIEGKLPSLESEEDKSIQMGHFWATLSTPDRWLCVSQSSYEIISDEEEHLGVPQKAI